jgi:DNA (cytosine-5)-methyltransferase 1
MENNTPPQSVICVAMRGRNKDNPSDRTTGTPTEQRLEPNSQGTTNTLTGVQKDNLIMIKSNTEKGFEEAKEGDSINFSNPSSKTRRGRVGKGKAQTLDTACNQGIISHYGHKNKEAKFSEISPTLKAESHRHEPMTNVGSNIRRLTEIECERLQGFPDNWTEFGNYDGVIKPIPKTQRYKLLGNAVTVNVVKAIGDRLIKITDEPT